VLRMRQHGCNFAQECKQPIQVLWLSKPAERAALSQEDKQGWRCIPRLYAKVMRYTVARLVGFSLVLGMTCASFAQDQQERDAKARPPTAAAPAVIWSDPGDIAAKNLLYGSGGEKGQPHPPFTFVEEDTEGSNPKFDVRDADGEKWKVKLGVEARPETVATRLLWAIGYFSEDDYLLPEIKVANLPEQLHRGQEFVKAGGIFQNARFKRHPKHTDKDGTWEWRKNPFTGTRELNALRVMMALFNNWDVKDENNAIYIDKETGRQLYLVSDLGASFGTIGYRLGAGRGKGAVGPYKHSKFISHVHKHDETVDFAAPAHSTVLGVLGLFSIPNFVTRMQLRWIGRDIPLADARWVGGLLTRLKPEQIEDAFRSAGYSDKDVRTYSEAVEKRIEKLAKL